MTPVVHRSPLPAPRSPSPTACTLRRDNRAVGGFFEEIPAFVVVVLSVSLFMVAAGTTIGIMGDDGELSGLQDRSARLCRAFLSCEAVLERGALSQEPLAGRLDAGKLDRLNDTALRGELNSPHPYNLTVRDLSSGREWTFGRPVPDGAPLKASAASAAVVELDDGRRDPARVEVVVWR
ncbi:MAG: hypothetical protein FJ149_01220 [Euryarchaeota archaeon]|nr:hypothetical protein [Euryarchaeota archaeon]